MSARAQRAPRLGRERAAASHLPYLAHVAPHVIATASGDLVQGFALRGLPFESATDTAVNRWHEQLNALWRNLAAPELALWLHIVRGRETVALPTAPTLAPFAAALDRRYARALGERALWANELLLFLVLRPASGAVEGMLRQVPWRRGRRGPPADRAAALEACEKLAEQVRAGLPRCEPQRLGLSATRAGLRSTLVAQLERFINGEPGGGLLPRGPLAASLLTARLLFGRETVEIRTPTETRLGAVLGIKEYPALTTPGLLNRLLSVGFPFVATQSFTCLTKPAAQGLLSRQQHRLANAGDFAVSQAEALREAQDALASNEFVMGDHHFSLLVLTEAFPAGEASGPEAVRRLASLHESVARARGLLGETGMVVAREDIALEAAYWAQLPGNFAYRLRRAPITSRNFAALAPLHGHARGRWTGNHWGAPVTVLRTSAQSAYAFSLHASDPSEPEGGSRRDTGHTFLCGPTGSGKTVLLGFLLAQLGKLGASQVVFDKDRGLALLVQALGGTYRALRAGEPSGMNPLALRATAANVAFLRAWLAVLARRGAAAMSVREAAELDAALEGTLALPPTARRLSRLVEFLDPTDPEGVAARLARWCERPDAAGRRGEAAWVFDNAVDEIAALLGGGGEAPRSGGVARHPDTHGDDALRGDSASGGERRSKDPSLTESGPADHTHRLTALATPTTSVTVGFDLTDILAMPEVRVPVALYLFHLVRGLMDGRRLVVWMDEFARLVSDPAFQDFAHDGLKTWRKLNAVAAFATQSPADVLGSPIARTLIEQTATKIYFPNPEASAEEYGDGLGLSAREVALVREELTPGSRRFLVRQGRDSVVCELDLQGFAFELAVISGRVENVLAVERLKADVGPEPERWLPAFGEWLAQRAGTRSAA